MTDLHDDFDEQWSQTARLRIKGFRNALGWTQKRLAAESGIPLGTLSPIESGADRVTVRNLLRIAQALGRSIDEFFHGVEVATSVARTVGADGSVNVEGLVGRFVAQVANDFQELGLRAGDRVTVDPDAPLVAGSVVVLDVQGEGMFHKVRSVDPLVLEREGEPLVLFDDRYHRVVGVAVLLHRTL